MPPTIPTETKHTSRQVVISAAIILILVLVGIYGYKWYRMHYGVRADQYTDREQAAYLEEAAKQNDARPTISEEDQNKFLEKVQSQNSGSTGYTDAEVDAYTNKLPQ